MQRPLYEELVQYYTLIEGRNWNRETALIAFILTEHRLSSVLDLGCGDGFHVRELAKRGFEVIGIDISPHNIRFARRIAKQENVQASFIVGSYYKRRPRNTVDAALSLNWSIPVRNSEIKRFLSNARSLLRVGGLLIFDYERVSEIVWADVGKPVVETWNLEDMVIARVSVGRIVSNVLCSRDVYIAYPKNVKQRVPLEGDRYRDFRSSRFVKVYVDRSFVRFFSIPEVRQMAAESGFRMLRNYALPRNRYRRNYAVLERVS